LVVDLESFAVKSRSEEASVTWRQELG